MSTIVAEFCGGGPKDGERRALPALLPSWDVVAFSPMNALFNGGTDPTSQVLCSYYLAKDENDEPVKNAHGHYLYEFRKPE